MYSKTDKPSYAQEDIVCYKIMVKNEYGWITPYMRTPVSNSIVSGKENLKANSYEDVRYIYADLYRIAGGFIHTFNYPSDAMIHAKSFVCEGVFECIIPKGVKYYHNSKGYASKEIKFVKKLTFNK
jgi:hypothetical protein